MDGTTATTVIPVTVGVCTILHLLLEKRIRERVEYWKDRATQAEKQSPDVLAQTLYNTVKILKVRLAELNSEKDTRVEEIKAKEAELQNVRSQMEELTEQMERARVVLEESEFLRETFSCPYCGSPLVTMEDHDEGHYESYACGYAEGSNSGSPCPHDPAFPTFDEYELETKHRQNSEIWDCHAKPKTKGAQKLGLPSTWGNTEQQAKERMAEKYKFAARHVPKKQ